MIEKKMKVLRFRHLEQSVFFRKDFQMPLGPPHRTRSNNIATTKQKKINNLKNSKEK